MKTKTKYNLMIIAGVLAALTVFGVVFQLTGGFRGVTFLERPKLKPPQYKDSDLPFVSIIDMINGGGEDGSHLFSKKASSVRGMIEYDFNAIPYDGSLIVISGWCMVGSWDGISSTNVEKYVWTVDGVNWFDAELYGMSKLSNAYKALADNSLKEIPSATFNSGSIGCAFQGSRSAIYPDSVSGLSVDLSERYAGQTVDVIFGAVPEAAPDSVIKIIKINGVIVEE